MIITACAHDLPNSPNSPNTIECYDCPPLRQLLMYRHISPILAFIIDPCYVMSIRTIRRGFPRNPLLRTCKLQSCL